jgi:hypothetical protein
MLIMATPFPTPIPMLPFLTCLPHPHPHAPCYVFLTFLTITVHVTDYHWDRHLYFVITPIMHRL